MAEGGIPAWSRHYGKLRPVGRAPPALACLGEAEAEAAAGRDLFLLLMEPSILLPQALDPRLYQLPPPTVLPSSPLQELWLAYSPTNELKSIPVMSPITGSRDPASAW